MCPPQYTQMGPFLILFLLKSPRATSHWKDFQPPGVNGEVGEMPRVRPCSGGAQEFCHGKGDGLSLRGAGGNLRLKQSLGRERRYRRMDNSNWKTELRERNPAPRFFPQLDPRVSGVPFFPPPPTPESSPLLHTTSR